MKPAYRSYFENRRTGEIGMPRLGKTDVEFLVRLIDANENWRADAVYFLAWNLYLMIFRPIKSVDHPDSLAEIMNSYYGRWIINDLKEIKEKANFFASRRERGYVSATSVAMALGDLAPRLETTKLQIWGPAEPDETPDAEPGPNTGGLPEPDETPESKSTPRPLL